MTSSGKTSRTQPLRFKKDLNPRPRINNETPDQQLRRIMKEQNVKPINDPKELRGDFWPKDEDIDEFVATYRQWRQEGK